MYNKSGFTKTTLNNVKQILFDVNNQTSVGCILATTITASADAKAGLPLHIDLDNLATPAVEADVSTSPAVGMNAILLHDVAKGQVNGTALIFGFVNKNRIDSTTLAKIEAAAADDSASKLLTFAKV